MRDKGALHGPATTTNMSANTPLPVDTAMANSSSNGRSRALSTSSDRPSTIGLYGPMSPPLSVSPEAAFIAASAASQIVTNDYDTQAGAWYDQVGIEPADETAAVSHGALLLANNFVDQLLFNILATAKSTALTSLRTAVVDVLKPKLAKDVINSADEELREYLGGGEIESLARSDPLGTARDWDLELVWKRTRLRCMVYSSLGDMEEEDEDHYLEQEHLNGGTGDVLTELVSPAVAIFLTSILEFIGEQVLIVAGQIAFNRLRTRYEKELKDGTRLPGDVSDRLVVEESDMERVALDRTFGRLWRAWKKRIRSPLEPNFSRPFSRNSINGSGGTHQRRESTSTELTTMPSPHELSIVAKGQPGQLDGSRNDAQDFNRSQGGILDPSMLPLPDSDIEATFSDEEESEAEELPSRPKSWFVTSHKPNVETLFTFGPPVKRTPSLPSRKKPRYNSIFNKAASDAANGESLAEHAKAAQLSGSPEDKAEVDTAVQSEAEISGVADAASPGVIVIREAVTPSSATVVTVQTNAKDDEIEYEIEEFAEEPEIMTSSRISIGGRSSPAVSEPGRPPIIHTRSSSVGSVRVIEVQAPRSRASSIESNPRSPSRHSLSISREGSVSRTPPIVEEGHSYVVPHVTVTNTTPGTALFDDGSHDMNTTLAPPPRNRSPPKSITPPILSHTSPPLNTSQEERYESFQRPPSGLRNPPMPTLPERSTSRPIYVQTTSVQRTPDSPRFPRSLQGESSSPARFKPTRTSEDSNYYRPADVARDFEQLIQSNETLQYTLTPENMRNIDSQPPPPHQGQKIRKSGDSKNSDRSRPSSITRPISIHKSAGLASYPPAEVTANNAYSNANSKALPPVSARNHTKPVPQARDPRVPRESMQDFADFIRSTGPPRANLNHTNGSSASSSKTAKSITGPPSIKKSSSMEARRGPKLQARDATVNASGESSELIDFIRQGPPNTDGGGHRIPRTVAPFRNTQDSDYMTSAVGGKAIDAIISNVRISQASTNITEISAPSSMNSQSALLNKSNRQQAYKGGSFDEDDMAPKRTRRRVQDPYAIDMSDEDDEFDVHPKPPPKKEESLIDFLNNYPPPVEQSAQPIVPPKKKSSTPNLIARLRTGSSTGINGSGHGRKGSTASEKRSLGGRTAPRATHTPIVIPTVADKYNSPSISPGLARNSSFSRVPMKKYEPRDAFAMGSQTADLANFLRDSAPPGPPPSMAALSPSSEDKASTGFSRMFERRKKPAAY